VKPLRIAFLCSEYPPDAHGGIGTATRELAQGLAARGHRVWVIGHSVRTVREFDGPVRVLRLGGRPTANPRMGAVLDRWNLSRTVRAFCRRARIDILEVPDWMGESAFLSIPTPPRCPVVIRYHGAQTTLARLRGASATTLTRLLEARAIRHATHRVAPSRFIEAATRAAFPGTPPADSVIPNGIDTSLFRPVPGIVRDQNRVLYVGRLSEKKGATTLAAILPLILERDPQAHLHIVGENLGGAPLENRFRRSLSADANARLNFRGARPHADLPAIYSAATCLLLPNRAESFGLAAIEAMACGCIPIVAQHSGPAELIRHGATGYTASAERPREFAICALRLLGDSATAARMRPHAIGDAVSTYGREAILAANESFYAGCLRP